MRSVLIMSILFSSNILAADWSLCQEWIKKQNFSMTGQFQDLNLSNSGKVSPADTARNFDTKDGKSFTMEVASSRIAFTDEKVRVMKTTATEMGKEIRVVRKWKDNKTALVKNKYKIVDKVQKYQVLSLRVLPSGKCVPMYKADFEYEIGKGMRSLIGKNDFFAPYCMELRFGHKKMSKLRKNQIARDFNSKAFLTDARDIIEAVYPESKLNKNKFKHVQANKSVNKTLDSIKKRCSNFNMESIGWNAWDNAEYKSAELSVNSTFDSSPSQSELIRKALDK